MPFFDDIGFELSGPEDGAGETLSRTNREIFENLGKGKVSFGGSEQSLGSSARMEDLAPRSSGEPEVRGAQPAWSEQPVRSGSASAGLGDTGGLGAPPTSGKGTLAAMRQAFFQELSDPETRRLLYASTQAEVGDQGEGAKQAYIESVLNRASATGKTLREVLLDRGYYPASTRGQLGRQFSAQEAASYNAIIAQVLEGSNVSNLATGNESGPVHSGGAEVTYAPGTGERFVAENWTSGWRAAIEGALSGGSLPSYASGGVVWEPTVAVVGEKGPEAIVPLADEVADKLMVKGIEDIPQVTHPVTNPMPGIQRAVDILSYGRGLSEMINSPLNPGTWVANLGVWPSELNRATGALGVTGAEPYRASDIVGGGDEYDVPPVQRMYNLGIRSPGERSIERHAPQQGDYEHLEELPQSDPGGVSLPAYAAGGIVTRQGPDAESLPSLDWHTPLGAPYHSYAPREDILPGTQQFWKDILTREPLAEAVKDYYEHMWRAKEFLDIVPGTADPMPGSRQQDPSGLSPWPASKPSFTRPPVIDPGIENIGRPVILYTSTEAIEELQRAVDTAYATSASVEDV